MPAFRALSALAKDGERAARQLEAAGAYEALEEVIKNSTGHVLKGIVTAPGRSSCDAGTRAESGVSQFL